MSAQTIVQALERAGVTLQRASVKSGPRVIGQSADRLTLIEVRGPLQQPKKIAMTGVFVRDDAEAARRNGQLMEALLSLVLPAWQARGLWLVTFLREAPQRRRETARLGPIVAELRYNGRLNAVTLTIWIQGGHGRGTTPTA